MRLNNSKVLILLSLSFLFLFSKIANAQEEERGPRLVGADPHLNFGPIFGSVKGKPTRGFGVRFDTAMITEVNPGSEEADFQKLNTGSIGRYFDLKTNVDIVSTDQITKVQLQRLAFSIINVLGQTRKGLVLVGGEMQLINLDLEKGSPIESRKKFDLVQLGARTGIASRDNRFRLIIRARLTIWNRELTYGIDSEGTPLADYIKDPNGPLQGCPGCITLLRTSDADDQRLHSEIGGRHFFSGRAIVNPLIAAEGKLADVLEGYFERQFNKSDEERLGKPVEGIVWARYNQTLDRAQLKLNLSKLFGRVSSRDIFLYSDLLRANSNVNLEWREAPGSVPDQDNVSKLKVFDSRQFPFKSYRYTIGAGIKF